LIVPETQGADALLSEKRVARDISANLFSVLSSIEFDGQPLVVAVEVQHAGGHGMLATELVAA